MGATIYVYVYATDDDGSSWYRYDSVDYYTTNSSVTIKNAVGTAVNTYGLEIPDGDFYFTEYEVDGGEVHTRYTDPFSDTKSISLSGVDDVYLLLYYDEGGGGPEPGDEYYYTCYNTTTGEYISQYSGTTDYPYHIRPVIGNLDYIGYVSWSSFAKCVSYYEEYGVDSTDTTGQFADGDYLVFFYEGAALTFHYACYNESSGQFISGYSDIPTTATSITRPDFGSYQYCGFIYHTSFAACLEQRQTTGGYDRTEITCSLHSANLPYVVFFYRAKSFSGGIQATGKTTAQINCQFSGGDSSYSRHRYIRIKLNGSWVTVGGYTYYPDSEGGGANSTFNGINITGLTVATTYTYEIHLYYYAGSSYVDTGYTLSGSFTTNQSATGLMIYVDGWKNAIPYVYYNGSWHRAYSRMYINGWKGL